MLEGIKNELIPTYLIQHPMQFIPCLNNTVSVIAVHNKYETLCVLEVVPPQWTDLRIELNMNI